MKVYFFLLNLSLMEGILISSICLQQSDMKSLIAYSSVVHMGLKMGWILTILNWELMGALMVMIAHGLCSSELFVLANICYESFNSRSLHIVMGLINVFPSLSLWWFLLLSSNMSAPPSLNLLGEIMLINSLLWYSNFSMILILLISFFSASYSLYLYSYSQHGKLNLSINFKNNINSRKYLVLFLHWMPSNLFFFK